MEQKRTNFRMDKEEVDRANEKLKEAFPNENLQATLLSEYLSKETKDSTEELLDPIHRPFVCTHNTEKCQARFRYIEDLDLHLEEHRNEDESLTTKAKRLLDSILHKS